MIDEYSMCKGEWDVPDEEGTNITYYCPKRDECFRYKARYQSYLTTFFDIIPIRIDLLLENCPAYKPWHDLKMKNK